VRQWWDLLRLNMSASDPGRAAVHEKGLSDIFKYGLELLDAVFGLKSPNTLLKRLRAIKLYNQWQIRNFTEAWIPLSEQRVWAYMRALKEAKAPASRAVSLLESIRFCHYMLKVDGALENLKIKGLAAQLYANKKPWHPSDVLTVNEVEFLHHCFKDEHVRS
jgi:site-specific recombinase XerD